MSAQHLALISGFPGCGKTTFMQWLAKEKQYLHLDMERGGLDREKLRDGWENFCSGTDRVSFSAELLARSPKVVLDWNFPPSCIGLVNALLERGCKLWWFEGDRLAARQRFLERGTEPIEAFDSHVGDICSSWQLIAPLVKGNIIRTIDANGNFLPPERIFQRFANSRDHGT